MRRLLIGVGLVAGMASTLGAADPPGELFFTDIQNGDLAQPGRTVHVTLDRKAREAGRPLAVEFFFSPEGEGRRVPLGADRTGFVRTSAPECERCIEDNVFGITLDPVPGVDGWGKLSARILGHTADDAFIRIFLSSRKADPDFASPRFMEALGDDGKFQVVAQSDALSVVNIRVGWMLAVPVSRHINQFEQHVLGPLVSPGGHASCVPTAVGANLAWLNDTGQWNDISPILAACQGTRDYCLVNTLGALMGTSGSGTSGSGGDKGLTLYLLSMALFNNSDYFLDHPFRSDPNNGIFGFNPETLFGHFIFGDAVSVGIHNLPNESGFGHFLALDNISINPDGSGNVTLMDPHTVNNPPTLGIYRLFHMFLNGKIGWASAIPAPGYYSPVSGNAELDEIQAISFNDFAKIFDTLPNAAIINAPALTTRGIVPGTLQKDGRTFMGIFSPPVDSPGPWVLVSEATLNSGHKVRSFRYVMRTRTLPSTNGQ